MFARPFTLTLLTPLLLHAAAPEPPAPRNIDELRAAIARVLKETNTPGVGIALVTRDGPVLIDGVGKADVATARPATADTLFRIGSVSKAFATLSILKLQEQGRLQLSDPARKYVSDVAWQNPWESTDPIRIVHLLEHTTGWDDLHLHEYASNDPTPLTLFQGLAYHPDSRVSRWRPGTRMAYCNAGPPVAAYIVEKITGKRFEDYVQENLFGPIHMATASYFYTPAVRDRLTTLYTSDGRRTSFYWHITVRPSGSINASPRDMANYVRFYLNRGAVDGVPIVKPESIERMQQPETTLAARDGLVTGYGLSNYATVDDRGFVWHGHNGGIQGGLTEMAYLPAAGVGYAYMINATNGAAFGRIHKLVTAFLTRDLQPPAKPASVPPVREIALQYCGWGEPANPRAQLTYFIDRITGLAHISLSESKLKIAPIQGPAKSYVPVTDRLWRSEKRPVPTLALITDLRDGRFVQADGTMYRIIPAWKALGQVGAAALILFLLATSLVFALYWVVALVFRRLRPLRGARLYLSVRILPLLAVLALLAAAAILAAGGDDNALRLGNMTPASLAICGLTIWFGILSPLALWQTWRARAWPIRRAVWIHSILVSAACTVLAGYLFYWGVIGLRTWA
ncbi:MAG: serine hydrolase domain-containing protein [Bryobacteraceae bacterium]